MHEYGVRLFRWEELPRADATCAPYSISSCSTCRKELQRKMIKSGCFIASRRVATSRRWKRWASRSGA